MIFSDALNAGTTYQEIKVSNQAKEAVRELLIFA
jgi:hypothetical protein